MIRSGGISPIPGRRMKTAYELLDTHPKGKEMKPKERLSHLQESDVGRWVVYHSYHDTQERGRIKSFDNEERRAFVVYGMTIGNENWRDYTSAATSYFDLEFEIPEPAIEIAQNTAPCLIHPNFNEVSKVVDEVFKDMRHFNMIDIKNRLKNDLRKLYPEDQP